MLGVMSTQARTRAAHLDVAVGDTHAVAVVQPDDELLEEPPGLVLRAAHHLRPAKGNNSATHLVCGPCGLWHRELNQESSAPHHPADTGLPTSVR